MKRKCSRATILTGATVIALGSCCLPSKVEAKDITKNYNLIQNEINNSTSNNIEIESIKLGKQGTITFTLSEATQLSLEDVSIICNGGKEMTILNMTTEDYKTYTLSTSYYKDNTYGLYVTLPNNEVISKDFVYNYNYPNASKVTVTRDSETDATLDIYGLDEGAYLYYLPVAKSKARGINNITSEYLKENGIKVNLVAGYNKVNISELKADKQYEIYYMMESFDGRISPMYNDVTIEEYKAPIVQDYRLEKVEENKQNNITFKFNERVDNLEVSDFTIVCPSGSKLTTTGSRLVQSKDGKTWTMIIPDKYQHADNKYTVTVSMPNGTTVNGSFTAHFNYPTISGETLTRPNEDTLRFEFNSDERGKVYYGVYEWNGEYNSESNNPKAEDVLNGKIDGINQAELNSGKNTIDINLKGHKVTKKTKIWVLYVDYANNYRIGYTDYHKVPEYVPSVVEDKPEVQTSLKIDDIQVFDGWSGTELDVYFNESLGSYITSRNIKLESLSGEVLPYWINMYIWSGSPMTIELQDLVLKPGKYKLTVETYDLAGNLVKVAKEFTVK